MTKHGRTRIEVCEAADRAINRRTTVDPEQPGDRAAVRKFVKLIASTTARERRDFNLGLEVNSAGGCYKSREIRDKKTDVLDTLAKFAAKKDVGNLYAGVEYVYIRTWWAVFKYRDRRA